MEFLKRLYIQMRPRWHKVLADLWSNKVRSLLVIASIAVGLFAVGMIANVYGILTEDMVASYVKTNPANIFITTAGFSEDFVDMVKNTRGVAEAEGVRTFSMRLNTGSEDDWVRIGVKAVPDFKKMHINQVNVLQGTFPPADKEVVFDQHKLSDLDAKIGDMVEVRLSSGKTRQMRFVGVVQDQTVGAGGGAGGYFAAPLQAYVTYDTLAWLEQSEQLNLLYVTVADNPNDIDHIRSIGDEISDKLEDSNHSVLNVVLRQRNQHPNLVYIEAISGVLFMLGFLVVFLSGFLITNTLTALLNQQIEQIGTMKTLGGRIQQIMIIYITLILVYSLIGLGFSLSTSGEAAYWLLGYLAKEVNFNLLGFRVVPLSVILQIVIAIIVPQVAGFVPILQGSLLSIQEAFNGKESKKPRKPTRWLDVLTERVSLPRPVLISLRNTFQHKGRLALTLVTLTLGGAIFIATFNVQTSMQAFINSLSKYFVADVRMSMDRPYRNNEVIRDLLEIPDVGSVEGWASARAELLLEDDKIGENVSIMAPPIDSKLIQPILLSGRWMEPGEKDTIALGELFLTKFPGIKPGDTIRLRINGKKTTWHIVGFFQFAGKSGGYTAYTNYEALTELTNQVQRSAIFQVVAKKPLKSIEEQKQLGIKLEQMLEDRDYRVTDLSPGYSLLKSAANGLDILIAVLLILAMLSAIVGSIGLTGTLSMNVLERTREIAVMRSIGASDRSVISMVVIEGLVIGAISWLLSCLLAFPISKALWGVISIAIFGSDASFTLTYRGFILWMLVVLVLTIFSCMVPARNAANLTIREALSYE